MPATKTIATVLTAGSLTAGGALLAFGGAAAQAKPHPHKHHHPGAMGMKHNKQWMKDGRHHPGGPWMMYRHNLILNSTLAPSTPTDPTLHGVAPGTNPWVLSNGHVVVTTTHLHLRVHGLLIPGTGTGAVKTVDASLYCGADSSSTPVATTAQVPLSSTGNATITDTQLTLPSGGCLAPIVLVHPNGNAAAYIAVDGQG
ncbi:hypothetical protein [Conexibacter sp. DBS9H8]|uniref:hypothetical protein n=1 Tax=Conexibacter sp. DBS9H8 TaxID=2937801 RepID=UPI00200C7CEA|nr:hypothetical protein [Conexibacter sp. DBS9H8]